MKTVGKQLQEARQARNWTPEMAARETKIKIERLRDLEADDYSNFTGSTYARGFVRTYARALQLDEYKILRQLDNKLPDDDSANIVSADGGVAYLPETALPPRAAHRDYTGLYVTMALGGVVAMAILFVLFEAYRVGELQRWFGNDSEPVAAATPATDATVSPDNKRALPVDSNTPPPIPQPAPTNTVEQPAPPASEPPRAQPVDLASLSQTPPAASADNVAPAKSMRALPVDPSEMNNTPPAAAPTTQANGNAPAPAPEKAPPRALPVSAADLAAASTAVTPPSDNPPAVTNVLPNPQPPASTAPVALPVTGDAQPLVLTASHDSFVRVTALDSAGGDKPMYSAVLRSGQSVGFSGHKFSVNVGNPSAVEVRLDGVNYGPLSERSNPGTFTVVSHVQ